MEEISKVISEFKGFIKRSLIPSSSFWMMFVLFDIYYQDKALLIFLAKEHHILMIMFLLIIFMGFAVLLNLLQQTIYDNRLKENFDGWIYSNQNNTLIKYRDEVAKRLNLVDYTDNILYQKIGKGMKTERYVDDIKTIGVFFISLLIMVVLVVYRETITIWEEKEISKIFIIIVTLFIMYIIYFIGKELSKAKYRSRAIRIYTNFLAKDDKKSITLQYYSI